MFDALPVAHHLLLAHGRAVAALRATGARSVGTPTTTRRSWAASDDPADAVAADLYDVLWNRIFADPMLLGSYPDGIAELMPGPVEDDLARDQRTARLLRPQLLQPDPGRRPRLPDRGRGPARLTTLPFKTVAVEGYPRTAFGWPVVPDGLREQLVGLRTRTATRCRRSTSPRAAAPTTTSSAPDGAVHDAGPDRLPRRAPAGRRAGDRARASTSAATTPGRCSTTSSGPRGTPSASAWCTSTTTPSAGPPRTRSAGTAT